MRSMGRMEGRMPAREGIRRKARAERRGSALVVTMLFGMLLASLGMVLSMVGKRSHESSRASFDQRAALHLAQGGLFEAWHAFRSGMPLGDFGTALAPIRLGEGVFWVEVAPLEGSRVRLLSTALLGSGRAAVQAVVTVGGETPLFRQTIHSDEALTVNEGVVIDSYDSSLGSYESQVHGGTINGYLHARTHGDVASNRNVNLNSQSTVLGDAIPGPGHVVVFNNNSYVHGATTPAEHPFEYTPIPAPNLPSQGMMAVPARFEDSLGAGNYGFDSFSLGTESILTVQGPATIVTRSFNGGRDARLVIDATNGPVTFFVLESFTYLRGFQSVAAPGSPCAVAFMIESEQDIVFPSQSRVRGGYYAPNASILFANNCEAWGAFAARRLEMSSSMRFHYDEHLSEYWDRDDLANPSTSPLGEWQQVPLAEARLLRDRRDPAVALGVDWGNLPTPSQVWPGADDAPGSPDGSGEQEQSPWQP
jgi:hypothetical protein